ncbi:MAG: SET domain-containing protein-lysine N-methyltransferase [Candidatus Gracilibacteria bacterium]
MAAKDLNKDKIVDQGEEGVPELVSRYWRLARSAAKGEIANGNAAFEMAEILHVLFANSGLHPFLSVRSHDPADCDLAMSNISILAENLWLAAQLKFGEENRFYPPDYAEARDQLVDGQTQKLEIKETEKAGQGLHAREAIKEGEIVFVCSGSRRMLTTPYESTELIEVPDIKAKSTRLRRFFYENPNEHHLVSPRNPDSIYPNAICIDQEGMEALIGLRLENPNIKVNIWLDPFEACPLRFLNHSCEPNVKRQADGVTFVAMRSIPPGEQLTCDYSTLEVNPDWKMKCQCGPKCRGTIGGIQSLPAELLQQYGTDLPEFMLDLFKESHPELNRDVLDRIELTRWGMGLIRL